MKRLYSWGRWYELECYLLMEYSEWWLQRTTATGLLTFNYYLCRVLMDFYFVLGVVTGHPKRPPTFNQWYVRICHMHYRRPKK